MNRIDCIIRRERPEDYRTVENVIREAFWNRYVPGCTEHYFAHMAREHSDFVSELDFVAEVNGEVVGSVMYTLSHLVDDDGEEKTVLTFGPIAVLPKYQRQGLSRALLEHSFAGAKEMGFDAIVIFGDACNYASRGFVSCKKHNVCLGEDLFPTALLVKELVPGALDGRRWFYRESDASQCCENSEAVEQFDRQFPPKEKAWQPSQEVFFINSRSRVF